jgi:CDP-glucose 4,6-dehydratase
VGTFATNVTGLINLFETVRGCPSVRALVNVTTDKVYAEHTAAVGYRETDPLGGHDPYSTSKACAELVTESYRKSFFGAPDSMTRIATARAGNVIGGGDWAEDRLVPDLVRATAEDRPLLIRNPAAVRPWQHVLEPLSGYLRLGQKLWISSDFAGAWNFGPGSTGEISVQSLAAQLGAHWPTLRIESDANVHPHEAAILRLNFDKARQQLAWRPVWDIDTTLTRTANWYHVFHEFSRVSSADDLAAYIDDARRLGLEWAA